MVVRCSPLDWSDKQKLIKAFVGEHVLQGRALLSLYLVASWRNRG